MKILFASSSSGSRGGGELYLLYLARALVARGHEVKLWVSDHGRMDEVAASFAEFGEVERADYTNTYDRSGRSIAAHFDHATARKVAREWSRSAPDMVHINKQNLEDGLDLIRAAGLGRIPTVCTIHISQSAEYLKAHLAGFRDYISRRALAGFRGAMVTVLENRAQDLEDFLGNRERQRMIVNGVPIFDMARREGLRESKRAEMGVGVDELLIIAVGRLVPQKRPMLFLETAAKIAAAVPEARFAWVGDGPMNEEWDAEVRARGMEGVVRRMGWQSDVAPFFAAADALLHVAEFEGLPLALLEAMSAALPCAISENLLGEMPFMNPANSIAVGTDGAWIAALRDRGRLESIGREARRLAEERFSFAKMAEDYEALYREVASWPR